MQRPSAAGNSPSSLTMGRIAGTLFWIGTAMTVIGLLLPHSPDVDVEGFWVIAAVTAVGGALLFRYAGRLPLWSYFWWMLLGSVIVTVSLYFNGERYGARSAGNQVLYVWVALYAGYFFSRRALAAQLAAIAALFGGVLLLIHPGSVGPTRWLITSGMVAAAAAIVHLLRLRNDELVQRLSAAARTDALTGLMNRQGFDECLARELDRSRRTGRPVALVIADIDHFKEINDRLGHAAGDAALRIVAASARQITRGADTLARIGGDEFAAILPETDAQEAFHLAERLRGGIAGAQPQGERIFTLSLGIAESERDGLTLDMLTGGADRALYEAKKLGRNQTVAGPGARGTIRVQTRSRLTVSSERL
jgi:diguanylate cyclase (GGDEF)-like protein